MKKLSLLVCMSLFMCSLTGCNVVDFLTQKVGKGVEEEKTEETTKTEEKTEKKKETKTEEDTTVYELSVMDLLNDTETYNGKKVRVLGVIPEGNITSADGSEVFGVLSEDGNYYIEITGTMPDNRNCKSYVSGTANLVDGEIVIDATGYEVVEQYGQETEQTTDQSQTVQQPQVYNYRIINGKYVFDTIEGQTYWDSTHPETEENNSESTSTDTTTEESTTETPTE